MEPPIGKRLRTNRSQPPRALQTKEESNIWDINRYRVDAKEVLGQGAFGIVYKATNEQGKPVAAKRINIRNERMRSKISFDLEKLEVLDHPNIVKVHDIHEEKDVMWVFMDLCEHGNFNEFFMRNVLTSNQTLEIMIQIMTGISYLHSMDVIHRDIKPENILVASKVPLQIKLTDFDVSKFLEEYFDTSAMSTNVGTQAFKAPEFFQRTQDGKLRYHRNVDVFAAGLTFLAMIQAKQKALIPKIETPQDASELFHPIGSLISTRIRYKVPELRILIAPELTNGTMEDKIRIVIQKMTCVRPEERLSAADAHRELRGIQGNFFQFLDKNFIPLGITCGSDDDLILVRRLKDKEIYFRTYHQTNGHVINEMKSMCDHFGSDISILSHPDDNQLFLELCRKCVLLCSYDMRNYTVKSVLNAEGIEAVYPGPNGTLISVSLEGQVKITKWDKERRKFKASNKQLK